MGLHFQCRLQSLNISHMPWSLETEGPETPHKIVLKPGHTITVGRVDAAIITFPNDDSMSGLHFAVSLAEGTPRIQNLSNSGNTELDGAPIASSSLKPGDRIKAGNTVFVVVGPAPSPYPAKVRFGGWGFDFVPECCQPAESVGFVITSDPAFRASITAVEEPLAEGQTLWDYVNAQKRLACEFLVGATLEGPTSTEIRGATEALALTIASSLAGRGSVIQRQVYAASDGVAGVFTVTMLNSQSEKLSNIVSLVEQGLSYFQG
jgi:hypothetical protein